MKKAMKIASFVLLALIICLGILLTYVKTALPNVGEPEVISIEHTPARLERGTYLANHVYVCVDCHSKRDWTKFSGPLVEGTIGMGGETFDQRYGFPGKFYSRNISPAGIGTWTDGELLRAISTGVSKSGRALFPVMPHVDIVWKNGRRRSEGYFCLFKNRKAG